MGMAPHQAAGLVAWALGKSGRDIFVIRILLGRLGGVLDVRQVRVGRCPSSAKWLRLVVDYVHPVGLGEPEEAKCQTPCPRQVLPSSD